MLIIGFHFISPLLINGNFSVSAGFGMILVFRGRGNGAVNGRRTDVSIQKYALFLPWYYFTPYMKRFYAVSRPLSLYICSV